MKTTEKFQKIEKFINKKSMENNISDNPDWDGILHLINVNEETKVAQFQYNQFDGHMDHEIDCKELGIDFEVKESFASYRKRNRKVLNSHNSFQSEGWGNDGNAYVDVYIILK